jgi:tetratricopeptide (TPR) repeat protein
MAATAVAQTQQGYVKTRGKLAADGKTVVAGERLSNAIVTIENLSPVKSGTNGTFSFALPAGANRYRLQGAELKGYTLADPDAIRQTHTYSKDLPLIVVLEDMKQREADLEAARKSVRNVMKREIRKKQDELDSLRDAHAITQAKYDSLVRDFWEYRQSSEKLVNEMAERYVSTDYDQLDDFNRQVQAYIESGQLTKADSMIRSKGSLEERFNRVKQYEATNAQREAEIQQQQKTLDNSRQYTQKEKDDLANDLYREHLIFLQQPMKQDKALYYLKLRADLDTTNMDAVWGYAYLSHNQKAFYEAEKYYKLALGNYEKLFAANPAAYRAALASTQNNLGILYSDLQDYASSERYYKLALENYEKLFAANPAAYRAALANTHWNMMLLYAETEQIDQYDTSLKKTLDLSRNLYSLDPPTYKQDIIDLQNRTVLRMLVKGGVDEALALAMENYALDETNETSLYYLAQCFNSKAYLYANAADYTQAMSTIDKAIELMPREADFYDSKGEILLMQGKNQEALKIWQKVLELSPKFLDEYPEGTTLSNGLKAKGLIK